MHGSEVVVDRLEVPATGYDGISKEGRIFSSEQVEVVKLIAILHNIPLNLAANRPCNEVLHASCNQVRRIRDYRRADPDMPLFNHRYRSLNCFRHMKSR